MGLGWNKSVLLKGRDTQALEAMSTGQGDLSDQLQRGCRRARCSQASPTQKVQANGRISLPGNSVIRPYGLLHLREQFPHSTLSGRVCLGLSTFKTKSFSSPTTVPPAMVCTTAARGAQSDACPSRVLMLHTGWVGCCNKPHICLRGGEVNENRIEEALREEEQGQAELQTLRASTPSSKTQADPGKSIRC